MSELTNGVSWAAVFAGAVVAFLVGWFWYSARLFGKGWAEGVGVELGAPTPCRWARWPCRPSDCC